MIGHISTFKVFLEDFPRNQGSFSDKHKSLKDYSYCNSCLIDYHISSPILDLYYTRLQNKMIYQHNRINNPNRRHNPLQFEVRTVQMNGPSLTLTIPSLYADILGIHAGDIMKITCQKDDRRLVTQKVILDLEEDDIVRPAY